MIAKNRLLAAFAALQLGLLADALPAGAESYSEAPMLTEQVKQGKLPPLAQRLPAVPLVERMDEPWRKPGKYGGELRMLMAGARDVRMMVVYGYARLVGYNDKYEIVPDILEKVDVDRDRVFTLHIRKGHKWSDGHPFTSEDFRYFWDDVANNTKLTPTGVPSHLLVGTEKPKFEVVDELTVRYSWSQPNPTFLPYLAATYPIYIYRPAHYLKQFHEKYADADKLQKLAREHGQRNWAALHNLLDNQYRNDNPDLPQLDPWINTTRAPSDRFVFVRNPFYHRVDVEGRQLPYVDRVMMNIADGKIIPAKTGSGEVDLQARNLRFDNYTFLRSAQKQYGFETRLWRTGIGSQVALYPNLNAKDPVWRELNRDVRYRRALSLAINRHEINQVIYYGLALEAQNTVLPESPLYRKEYAEAWTRFDLKEANRLLDEIGLSKRDDRGFRLLPDGRVLEVIVETAGESTEQVDVLELIRDSWAQVGIKLFTKPSQREVFRNRIFSGDAMMVVSTGLDNGIPTPDMTPDEVTPVGQQQYQWPKWGQFNETKGKAGEPPDLEPARALLRLHEEWRLAPSRAAREKIWHSILAIGAEQVYTVGVIAGVLQPVVVSNRLRNLPEKGMYNWEPGAHLGIYRVDGLWFDGQPPKTAAAPAPVKTATK
ncbi:MAG: ABC transporter substrate-binding protein [Alphaproteobacteria bacterium]|nr:ABC transporter substrate-binding protein [Alphaproteobacteria bacterium]